jgi:GNAT superfamily N-acetyltransferase
MSIEYTLPRELGNGLLLRQATLADAEAIANFNSIIHGQPGKPEERVKHWTLALMKGDYPSVSPADFLVVVDQKQDCKIVSTLCLISQIWSFNGIEMKVGQPEIVGTDPEYRRKGLIRAQFEAIHAISKAKGEIIQAITGIPWYYRQFGYEMALNLNGYKFFYFRNISKLAEGETEQYRYRPVTTNDIPVLTTLYESYCKDQPIWRVRNNADWQREISITDEKHLFFRKYWLFETLEGVPVGYFNTLPGETYSYNICEVAVMSGHPLRIVCEYLTRLLNEMTDERNKGREKPFEAAIFSLGETSPVYEALGKQLEKLNKPYAWYIRVADLPDFLRRIAPVLEKRLSGSVFEGFSGTLKLNFYVSHLQLTFEKGKLTDIRAYQPQSFEDGDALFPYLTFLQSLFGHRSYSDLRYAFADCYPTNERSRILIETLFPQQATNIIVMG